jgi:hypothetical protein
MESTIRSQKVRKKSGNSAQSVKRIIKKIRTRAKIRKLIFFVCKRLLKFNFWVHLYIIFVTIFFIE